MLYPLIIVIVLPVVIGITIVSPFDPPETGDEQTQDAPVGETPGASVNVFLFILTIVWLFFLLRIVILVARKYRSGIRTGTSESKSS